MALTKCVDCGTEVSDQAAACPKCAAPMASAKYSGGGMGVVGLVMIIIGAGLYFFDIGQFYGAIAGVLAMVGGLALFLLAIVKK